MSKLTALAALAAVVSPAMAGASASRIFAGFGPRIALEKPNEGGLEGTEIKALIESFKGSHDKVKEIAEKALSDAKSAAGVSEETKKAADEALTKMNGAMDEAKAEIKSRLEAIEQKIVRPGAAQEEVKSLGECFLADEGVKAFLGSSSKRGTAHVKIEGKAVVSLGTNATTLGAGTSPSNSLIQADRQGMVLLPDRPLTVRDLITPGQTSSNSIEYAVEVAFQNMAAPVAEMALKPKSDISFDLKQTGVKTIAHFMKASRQIMDDVPMLRSFIDGRLRYGLQYVEEAEVLNGDGTGQHLLGLIPQATAYSAPFAPTDETPIDRLRLAALQASLALYPSTGYVLHPTDWARIEMIKDGMGRYLIGDPQGTIAPRLWGLQVVASMAMTAGTFLTGAFKLGAQIFDRMAIEILLATENEDDFVKNMVTIRGEERLALAVYRPAAFITGNLPS